MKIDPRGPRFGAAITSFVLALSLALGPTWGLIPLAWQAIVFLLGVIAPMAQPYSVIFRLLVRPRLAPPSDLEDPRPPRFAQGVGLGFAVIGLVGGAAGWPALFYIAVGMALIAALLNAALDFCLGCEMYVALLRLRGQSIARRIPATDA